MSKGVSEVIATLLMLIITIAMAGLAYSYISGVFVARTGKIVEIDSGATFCSNNVITAYVRNVGTVDFASKDVGIQKQGVDTFVACDLAAATETVIGGGPVIKCDTTITGTQGNNIIVVGAFGSAGPTNTVRVNVFCP